MSKQEIWQRDKWAEGQLYTYNLGDIAALRYVGNPTRNDFKPDDVDADDALEMAGQIAEAGRIVTPLIVDLEGGVIAGGRRRRGALALIDRPEDYGIDPATAAAMTFRVIATGRKEPEEFFQAQLVDNADRKWGFRDQLAAIAHAVLTLSWPVEKIARRLHLQVSYAESFLKARDICPAWLLALVESGDVWVKQLREMLALKPAEFAVALRIFGLSKGIHPDLLPPEAEPAEVQPDLFGGPAPAPAPSPEPIEKLPPNAPRSQTRSVLDSAIARAKGKAAKSMELSEVRKWIAANAGDNLVLGVLGGLIDGLVKSDGIAELFGMLTDQDAAEGAIQSLAVIHAGLPADYKKSGGMKVRDRDGDTPAKAPAKASKAAPKKPAAPAKPAAKPKMPAKAKPAAPKKKPAKAPAKASKAAPKKPAAPAKPAGPRRVPKA